MTKIPLLMCTIFCAWAGVFAQDEVLRSTPITDSSQQIADKIIKSKMPVIIDFWAPWCAPCRMLNPIFKQLEKDYKGKVLFMKVNIDIHRGIASYFGISSIPAVFVVHNRAVTHALRGLQPKEAYSAALDEAIAAAANVQARPDSVGTKNETP